MLDDGNLTTVYYSYIVQRFLLDMAQFFIRFICEFVLMFIYSYDLYIPMHNLWTDYINDLIKFDR